MSQSVVFQVYSETGTFGIDMAIVATSVIQVLRRQGIEAYVRNEGLEGLAWSEAHDVPEADETTLETCEVLLRAWPVGQWPERPDGPRTVVDFVRRPADRSHNSNFVVAFEADGTAPFPGLLIWDVLFPLPVEVNEVIKETVEDVIMIHLGQDPTSRLSGLQLAINGFAGMVALGLQYPGGAGGPGIIVTPTPWDHLASGDVAIVTPEFPFRLAAAMRVPAVLLGFTPDELARVQELTTRGHSSFLSLQLSSGLTNNQIRDAARDFRNCDTAKRVARLAGSEQQADEGVMRIASWVARELIGFSVISADPFNVQGFDTIFDPHTKVPLNAADSFVEEGGQEEEVPTNVQVFTADGTWTKPDSAKMVHVRLIAGGAGGGSGRRGAAGTGRGGGGAGAGGEANEIFISASALPPTVAVIVGLGGAGALGQSVDDSNGLPGVTGNRSTFGDVLRAGSVVGNGGQGGTTVGVGGGVNDPLTEISYLASDLSGFNGGGGGSGGGGVSFATTGAAAGCAGAGGGGGGAGINVANVSQNGATGGVGAFQRADLGLLGGAAGNATVQDGGDGEAAETNNVQGGGGGGGGSTNGAVPGMGGAGGFPGGGGGGGSASLNGTPSGAGGQGGNGLVVVTTFF